MSAPVYSLVYNGIYLSVEAVLTLIVLYLPPVKKVMGQFKNHGDTEIKRTLCEHFRFIKKDPAHSPIAV